MATRPRRPARPGRSADPGEPQQAADPDEPEQAADPGEPQQAADPDAPDAGHHPVELLLAAAAQLMEAAGLVVAGVFAAIATADGRSYQLTSGIALTLIAFGTAVGLAPIAVGLARARPWSRIPAAMTQLFAVIGGVTLLDGNRPEWGVPALVLAGLCLAGLLTPASVRALNRPPAQRPPAHGR